MNRLRALAAAAVATGVVTAATAHPLAVAAPNPYGVSLISVAVELDIRGTYTIDVLQQQELYQDMQYSFKWSFPNYVRLPDDPAQPLPGLLKPRLGPPKGALKGLPRDVRRSVTGRLVTLEIEPQMLVRGKHQSGLNFKVDGSSIGAGDRALTYIRVPGDTPDIALTSPTPITQVYCVTTPPMMTPCGAVKGLSAQIGNKDYPYRGESINPGLQMIVVERPINDLSLGAAEVQYT